MNIWMKSILTALSIFVLALLSGCGGGGGGGSSTPASGGSSTPTASTIISGTAAAGAPVVGYVSVRDSSTNPQPVKTNIPIEANGHYTVDVSGLTPPFAFLASGTVGGKTVSLYSAATSADVGGTINITPFTDLMIRNIAATAIDTYINSGGFSTLTASELDAKRIALTNQLAPALTAMGLSDSIDLLRATFNADSTGLDRFMDVVKVDTTTPGAVTITNIMDAAHQLTIDTTQGTSSGTLGTTGMAASATPLDGIMQTFNTFSGFFATGLPNPAAADLVALFSSTFKDDGEISSVTLTDLTTDPTLIGLKFTNVVVDSIDAAGTIAQVHFRPLNAAGVSLADGQTGGALGWQMKKNVAGVWQFDGNQRIAHVDVRTNAEKNICSPSNAACTMTTNYRTGLHFEIDDRAMLGIGSAVVTGPGLPVGGVTLVAQVNQTWFNITTTNANNSAPCGGCTGGNNNWSMADTEIAAVVPNSVYTVKLYDNSATPALLDTYTEVLPVAPVLNTALSTLTYPSMSGMANLMGMMGTTLPLTWTIPAGLSGGQVGIHVSQTGSPGQDQSIEADLSTKTGSGTSSLVITAPPTGSWTNGIYWIDARDQYGGQVNTNYQ